jgi:Kef-type K+ transport system membrane component KefB
MKNTEALLFGLIIVFSVPYIFWRTIRAENFAPLVVVQIICGIVLGPGVLGAAFPAYYAFVFAQPIIDSLNGIALWAVMLFVWVAGIELDLGKAWQFRGETGITAGLALGMPLLFGSGVALLLLFTGAGWIGDAARPWQFVIGIGMASAVTALPILVLFLEKLEILREPLGQRILRYASIDDIAIWAVLAAIMIDWERIGRQAGFLLIFAVASYGMRRLLPRLAEVDRWHICLIWLAVCGFGADWAGLHFMVGAFLSGAIVDARLFDPQRLDHFRGTVLMAFMPVFFLSTGLRTKWDVGGAVVFSAAGLLLLASVAGKLAGTHLAGRILGWQKGEARLIGWLLQTKALIMIIFANILLDKAIITPAAFTALLLMAVGSTMLTMPIVTPMLKRDTDLRQKSR